MTARLWQRFTSLNKTPRRLLQSFLAVFLLFGLFGYLVLPSIIRSKAEELLTQTLHRPVSIEKVSISPYWFSVTLHNFKVAEPDGKQTFLSSEALRVRISPRSILRMAPVLGNITLIKPYLHLSRNSAGQLNIQDLLTSKPDEPAQQKPDEPASSPAKHTIGSINIEGGNFIYENTAQGKTFRAAIEAFDLDIDTLQIDLENRKISFDEIESNSATYKLTHLKSLKDFPPVKKFPPPPVQKREEKKKPYVIQIEDIRIQNWGAQFEDLREAAAPQTAISGISLSAQKITSELGKSNSLDVKASINNRGTLHVKGAYSISPLSADLDLAIKDANIAGLRPLFADNLNLIITSARMSANGNLKIKENTQGGIAGTFKASAALDDVNCIDSIHQRPLLGWKSLAIKDIHAELMPLGVTIDSVTLEDYFAHLAIDQTGHLNLKDVIKQKANQTPKQTKSTRNQSTGLPFSINTISLKQGQIHFIDDSVKLRYRGEISKLNVTVSGLSSEKNHSATLNIDGRVNRSPLSLKGNFNPFSHDLSLNLRTELRGLELLPLATYSSQYAGYGIEEGTLSLKSQYKIANQQLKADNRLIVDRLALTAEPTNPEKALPLPLAAALLRDVHGVIDINLPISGSLNDPDFSVGGLVVQVLVNTIMKAVTSPFSLLGSAFGDGADEMGWLAFAPGQSGLDEKNQKKLSMLAEALNNRPALKLEITGMADLQADDEGLRRENMNRRILQLKMEQMDVAPGSDAAKKIEVTSSEYPALLKEVYLNEIGFSFGRILGKEKDKTVDEMEKLLMSKVKIEKNDVPALAVQRATAAKSWLTTYGKIPAERIEMLPGKLISASNDPSKGKLTTSRVEFNLKQ